MADINLKELVKFHTLHNKLATITAVKPPGRYGAINLNGDNVISFVEKPLGQSGFINGGFFVLSNKVLDYIEGDQTIWENEPLKNLSKNNELKAFYHEGFWQPMDTSEKKFTTQIMG